MMYYYGLIINLLLLVYPAQMMGYMQHYAAQVEGGEYDVHRIDYARSLTNDLTDQDSRFMGGRSVQFWTFSGTAGSCVLIQMRSNDFIPYVQLVRDTPVSAAIIEERRGAGPIAGVRTQLPATGDYFVRATSAEPNQYGSYTLSLRTC